MKIYKRRAAITGTALRAPGNSTNNTGDLLDNTLRKNTKFICGGDFTPRRLKINAPPK